MKIKKIVKLSLIFVLVFSWLLTGWPGIQITQNFRFPLQIARVSAGQQEYTTGSGNFTPSFTGSYTFTLVGGGGGGGGGASSTNGRGGGGGGGGGLVQKTLTLSQGTNYAYVVGSSGGGGAVDTNGGDGTASTFIVSGTTYTAGGGGGGKAPTVYTGGTAGTGTNGDINRTGGAGGTGTTGDGAGGGSGAGTTGNGNNGTVPTGGSAVSSYGGKGGDSSTGNNFTGNPGETYGGGGGGGTGRSGTGGDGYAGYIIITWTDPITTLADGTNPSNSSIGPGGSITDLDAFTLINDTTTDTINSLTVTLGPTGAYNNIDSVSITDNSNTVKCTLNSLTSDTLDFTSCGLSVTTSSTIYKVRVTPKSHANMPSPSTGVSYDTTGTVTSFTSANSFTAAGTDGASATVTIDNASPNGATSVSANAGNAKATLNWTTSNSTDFNTTSGSVIYRWVGSSAGSEVPVEGSTPTAGNTNGTATVACVISSNASTALSKIDGTGGSAGCTTTPLTNGQAYTYAVFQKDSNGNYDTGVSIGTVTPTDTCSSKATGNWSSGGTWTGLCSGGSGQPIAGDIVSLTAGFTVTVDGAQAASRVTINNTGVLTFASGGSLTLGGTSGTLLTNNGTLTMVSNSSIIVSSPTAPTAILSGSFTGSNAFYNLTLSPTISGAVGYTMGAAFTVDGNLTLDPTSSGNNALTVTLSGATIVAGLTDLKGEVSGTSVLSTGTNQALTTGTINIEAGGTLNANSSTITINGTSGPLFTRTGVFNAGGSTVNFSETTSDLTLNSGTITFNNLQISMSGKTGTLGNAITVGNNLAISTGTLADGGFQITGNATGTLSAAAGTALTLGSAGTATTFPTLFTAGAHISLNATSVTTYASAQAQNISSTPVYGNLTVSGASTKSLTGTTTVAGTLTISAGTLTTTASNYNMSIAGDWTNNATFTAGTGTVTFNGTTTQAINGSSTTTFGSTTDSNTSASVVPSVNFAINGALTVNGSANFSPSAGIATFNNGSSISNSGTLVFYGLAIAASSTVSTSSSFSIANSFSVGGSGVFSPSGSSTITFTGGTISNSGTLAFVNVSITGGTTTSSSFSVSGNWSSTSTFTASAGTITLNGANSSTQAISGNSTFYNLSASTAGNTATRTIQYTGGGTTTVSGTWTMNGTSSYVLTLQSDGVSNWTITPSASSVDYVYLSRSTNTVGTICATHSTEDGNNLGYSVTSRASCVNTAPNIPSLDLPIDTATNQPLKPIFKTTTTDSYDDYVEYKIIVCEDVDMSVNCLTYDQTSSQTGWSGQDANGGNAYASGTQATYTVSSRLQNTKTYYWKSYAIDPTPGSNTWSSTQTVPFSFTTTSTSPAPDINSQLKGLNFKGINIK